MNLRAREKNWWDETRERIDLRENVRGVVVTLMYAGAIIAMGLILSLIIALAFNQGTARAADSAAPELVTSVDLIEHGSEIDGTPVTFEGEAIGEALERGRFAWVNIGDKKNAVGIWMTRSDARRIGRFGDYNNTGDFVRVVGRFHRACPQHGGDLDIHAQSVEVLSEGATLAHPVSAGKLTAAGAAVLVALFAAYLNLKRRRNR